MTTPRTNRNPKLTKRLIRESCLTEKFFLVDVGASGGIDSIWKVYGEQLRAVGFDPLVNEVERLNRNEKNPHVHYENAFVGWKQLARVFQPSGTANPSCDLWQRSSAGAAVKLMRMDYVKQQFNAGDEVRLSNRHIELDEFFTPCEHKRIDFLKIDTDGHDYPVLLGAERLLRDGGVLGIAIESQFHGYHHQYANVFHNIDRYLRGAGFSLFDVEVYRYSRADLPLPFLLSVPAQTGGGQTLWGEAVYFRDLAQQQQAQMWKFEITEQKILKLATLFELFGLADCAVELLLAWKSRFPSLANPKFLDLLTPPLHGRNVTYREYTQAFRSDPHQFFQHDQRRRSAINVAHDPKHPDTATRKLVKRVTQLFRRRAA